jgi:hypothetical protein
MWSWAYYLTLLALGSIHCQKKKKQKNKTKKNYVLVAHACNPSYSGGRDQEDHGSKPA